MAKSDLFHEKAGEFITHDTAKKYQKNYLEQKVKAKEADPIRSEFFGVEHLRTLMSKPGCVGIKAYYGTNDKGEPALILVAADAGSKNLEKNLSGLKDPGDRDYLAHGPVCPLNCN